jgi:hypothetical protein
MGSSAQSTVRPRGSLEAAVDTFQQVVDYHAAQFRVGTLAEQDLLRVELESERLKIAAGLGALDATRTRAALFKAMGRAGARDVVLIEPLDVVSSPPAALSDEAVLARELKSHWLRLRSRRRKPTRTCNWPTVVRRSAASLATNGPNS